MSTDRAFELADGIGGSIYLYSPLFYSPDRNSLFHFYYEKNRRRRRRRKEENACCQTLARQVKRIAMDFIVVIWSYSKKIPSKCRQDASALINKGKPVLLGW